MTRFQVARARSVLLSQCAALKLCSCQKLRDYFAGFGALLRALHVFQSFYRKLAFYLSPLDVVSSFLLDRVLIISKLQISNG